MKWPRFDSNGSCSCRTLTHLSNVNIFPSQKFIINLSEHPAKQLTFGAKPTTDSRLDIYNRASIHSIRCRFGEKTCVEAATKEFEQLRANADYK